MPWYILELAIKQSEDPFSTIPSISRSIGDPL